MVTTGSQTSDGVVRQQFLVSANAGASWHLAPVHSPGGGQGVQAALGHPAAAVAWLVRNLAVENEGLRAGDIVLSGGLTAAVPVKAGDVVTATADRLGSVELGCV